MYGNRPCKVMNLRFACIYHKAGTQPIGIGGLSDTSDTRNGRGTALLRSTHFHQDLQNLWRFFKKTSY